MSNFFTNLSYKLRMFALAACVLPSLASANESNGVLTLIDVVDVSAESTGVLTELPAREGSRVSPGDLLAKVDNEPALIAKQVAELQLAVEQTQADNDSRLRAAVGRARVAQAEYTESVAINEQVSQAIPQLRVRRLQLSTEQAQLEVEVAQMEQRIVDLQRALKEAELSSAQQALDRCRIGAPFEGTVVERYKHVGEWVRPGDPILKLCRLDRLRVEWLLSIDELAPHRALGVPVSATIQLGEGGPVKVAGSIDFVSPMVEPTGEYRVWSEFDNPRDQQENWLLRAGLEAKIRVVERAAISEHSTDNRLP